jgi:hypothetical protein
MAAYIAGGSGSGDTHVGKVISGKKAAKKAAVKKAVPKPIAKRPTNG